MKLVIYLDFYVKRFLIYNEGFVVFLTEILTFDFTIEYDESNLTVKLKLDLKSIPPTARYIVNYKIDDKDLAFELNGA
jgi:hypothetical protein